VIRDPGEGRLDKLVILYKATNLKNPREAFQTSDSGIGNEDTNDNEASQQIKRTLIALITKSPPPLPAEENIQSASMNVAEDPEKTEGPVSSAFIQ